MFSFSQAVPSSSIEWLKTLSVLLGSGFAVFTYGWYFDHAYCGV